MNTPINKKQKQSKFKYSNLIIKPEDKMSLDDKTEKNEEILRGYKKFFNNNKHLFTKKEIKRIEDYFKSGFLFLINSAIEGKITANLDSIKKTTDIYVAIRDHSMDPILPKGSVVILQGNKAAQVGDIAAVELKTGEVFVRRITKKGKIYTELKPENNIFKTMRVNQTEIKKSYKGWMANIQLNNRLEI